MIDSFDMVIYTGLFLLPGFIIHGTIKLFNPLPQENIFQTTLRNLLYSILCVSICSILILPIVADGLQNFDILLVLAILIIASIILGFILAWFRKRTLIRWLFSKLNLMVFHPDPTSWDYVFNHIKDERIIVVTLKNGDIIKGRYSNKSFTSTEPLERDIFLEKCLIYNQKECNNNEGILIKADVVQTVQFFKMEEE